MSANADANVSGEGTRARAEAELDGGAEGAGEMSRSTLSPSGQGAALVSASGSAGSTRVLLGARHDLKLRPEQANATCECLALALGGSRHGGMLWTAVPPELDESTQLSLALSSEGQACKDEPKKSMGASYWGYRISGNDVIVLVEAARGGRPLTNGAIIPKPVGAGAVYVAPASNALPYGRALEGKGLCKLGNPGQARSAPFSEVEVGTDAPAKAKPGEGIVRQRVTTSAVRADDAPTTIEIPSD